MKILFSKINPSNILLFSLLMALFVVGYFSLKNYTKNQEQELSSNQAQADSSKNKNNNGHENINKGENTNFENLSAETDRSNNNSNGSSSSANSENLESSNSLNNSPESERKPANEISTKKSLKAIQLQNWLNNKFPSKSKENEGWNVTNYINGEISFIRGGEIPCGQIDDLPNILQPLLRHLEIPDLQLQYKDQVVIGSDEFTMVHIPQVFQNYKVDDAKITVAYNQITKKIYSISLDVRSLGSGFNSSLNIDSWIQFSKEQAIDLVKNRLAGKVIRSIQSSEQVSVFNKKHNDSYLVWRVSVEISRPLMDAREYLVSAQTGDIIYESSLMMQ